ncbi:MAG: ATP-binding protein [Candidatus Omnitrophota bacterium]
MNKKNGNIFSLWFGTIVLLGVILGVFFWVFEVVVHIYVFGLTDQTFMQHLLMPDPHEFWMRSCVVVLLVFFGFYAQHIVNLRKHAEKKVYQQNQFFFKTIDSLTHPFYVIDTNDYKIQVANSAACQNILPKDKTCYEITHKRINPCAGIEHGCPLEKVKRTKKPAIVEHIHYDSKGNLRNVEVHAYPIFDEDGDVIQMIEYSLDITERKRAEERLKQALDVTNTILKELPFGIIIVGLDKRIRKINKAALEMMGIKDEKEVVGKICHNLICPAEDNKCPIIDLGEEVDVSEKELIDKNGKRIPILKSVLPIILEGEEVLLESFIDIAERKKAEEALLKARDELETRVKERTKELEAVNRVLKDSQVQLVQSEKMASLGQLAAGIAHEINNPMGFILSNLNTLNEYVKVFKKLLTQYEIFIDKTKKLKQYKEFVSAIMDIREENSLDYIIKDVDNLFKETKIGADRVKDIVEGLRTFAHTDETTLVQTDINKCLENTLKIVWNEIKYKCDIDKKFGKLPLVFCHPGQINQVFMNLLVNAAQAIAEEGIITIETSVADSHVLIKIADTGKGIAPENLLKVFDPFFTTKEVGKGTGLGLSISHGIIKKHGGTIEVESKVGEGSVFTIKLPIK